MWLSAKANTGPGVCFSRRYTRHGFTVALLTSACPWPTLSLTLCSLPIGQVDFCFSLEILSRRCLLPQGLCALPCVSTLRSLSSLTVSVSRYTATHSRPRHCRYQVSVFAALGGDHRVSLTLVVLPFIGLSSTQCSPFLQVLDCSRSPPTGRKAQI